MTPHQYLHAINTIPGIGSRSIQKLIEHFDVPEAIWKASSAELKASGIKEKTVESIIDQRPRIDISQKWSELESMDISLITADEAGYPTLLKEIPHPPLLLYKKGSYDWNSKPIITIVGSRHCTPYGARVAQKFAEDLASVGFCVASGLAFGIDAAAHTGVLEAKGSTVAVLGNSLDNASISPKANFPLAQNILRLNGALLSEYPPRTAASKLTFPARNRILAGMSQGTIIIESAARSGSLITARFALEFNREVFAVPGSIFSEASIGPHDLIKKGAKLVASIQDIIEEIQPQKKVTAQSNLPFADLSSEEAKIFSILSQEPLHIDKILKTTTLETSQVQSAIVFLEVKGLVKNIGGMNYIRL